MFTILQVSVRLYRHDISVSSTQTQKFISTKTPNLPKGKETAGTREAAPQRDSDSEQKGWRQRLIKGGGVGAWSRLKQEEEETDVMG